MNIQFSQLVKNIREAHDLTQLELLAGLNQYAPEEERYNSKQTASQWEHGDYPPRRTWLYWVNQHAPDDSWQREFTDKALQIMGDEQGGEN